jgi:hypothetical protein
MTLPFTEPADPVESFIEKDTAGNRPRSHSGSISAQTNLCGRSSLAPGHETTQHYNKYLLRVRVKKPHFHEHGVSIGGEDQAWLYRDSMRDVWVGEPGVLDWLKKESGKFTQ